MRYVGRQLYRWPISHAYATVLVFQGILTFGQHPTVDESSVLVKALGGLAIIAGVLILVGLQWRRDRILSLQLEKIGHLFGVAVWSTEIVLVWLLTGGPQWDNLTASAFLLASGVKAWRLHNVAARQKRQVGVELAIATERQE